MARWWRWRRTCRNCTAEHRGNEQRLICRSRAVHVVGPPCGMDQHLCRRKRRGPALRLMAALGSLLGLAATLRAAPGDQALELDSDRSSIEVLVQATFGQFTGKLPQYDADIRVDVDHHVIGRAVVNFTFADLKTGIALRDRHMGEWEDTARYPNVSFHLDSIETAPDNRTIVHGGLVLH